MRFAALLWNHFYGRAALVALAVLGCLWALLGTIAIEKIVAALLMPAGLVWVLLSILLVEAIRSGRRAMRVLAALVWAVYTIAGNGIVSGLLAHSLEDRYAGTDPLEQGLFDVVIVLGGGANVAANGRNQGNGAGDRLILAAQLYHQGAAQTLICTGRRIVEMDASGVDPAESSAAVLRSLGVPLASIELAGGRNTHEEMLELAQKFGSPGQRVGLLTSAWHMPRAQRLAAKCGFDPVPLPANFVTGSSESSPTLAATLLSIVPNGAAFSISRSICKEYLQAWLEDRKWPAGSGLGRLEFRVSPS